MKNKYFNLKKNVKIQKISKQYQNSQNLKNVKNSKIINKTF